MISAHSSTGTATTGTTPSSPGRTLLAAGTSSPEKKLTALDMPMKLVSQGCKQLVVGMKLWKEGRLSGDQIRHLQSTILQPLDQLRQELLHAPTTTAMPLLSTFPTQLVAHVDRLLAMQTDEVAAVDREVEDMKRLIVGLLQTLSQLKQQQQSPVGSPSKTAASAAPVLPPRHVTAADALLKLTQQSAAGVDEPKVVVPDSGVSDEAKHQEVVPTVQLSAPQQPVVAAVAPQTIQETYSETVVLFLKWQETVRRIQVNVHTMDDLSRYFVETFSTLPSEGQVYIQDGKFGVVYELTQVSQLFDGAVLEWRASASPTQANSELDTAQLDQLLEPLRLQLQTLQTSLQPLMTQSKVPQWTNSLQSSPERSVHRRSFTGTPSAMDKRSTSIAAKRKELHVLRRDLGIMRQIFGDYRDDIKQALDGFRGIAQSIQRLLVLDQNSAVRMESTRHMLEVGKTKVQEDQAQLAAQCRAFADAVNETKVDVVQRGSYPSASMTTNMTSTAANLQLRLSGLQDFIAEVKPIWKQTWEQELQNIVKEQQLIKSIQEAVDGMEEELQQTLAVFDQVKQFVELKQTSKAVRRFEPKARDEHHEGLPTVMREITGVQIDTDRRVKALARTEQQRQSATPEPNALAAELDAFVGSNRLRRTGGVDEVERMRKQRERDMMEALFDEMES